MGSWLVKTTPEPTKLCSSDPRSDATMAGSWPWNSCGASNAGTSMLATVIGPLYVTLCAPSRLRKNSWRLSVLLGFRVSGASEVGTGVGGKDDIAPEHVERVSGVAGST